MVKTSNSNRNKTIAVMIFYLISFYFVWSLYTLFVVPFFGSMPFVVALIGSNLCKILIWTIPVIILLVCVFRQNPLDYLKLKRKILRGIVYGVLLGVFLVEYIFFRMIMHSENVNFNPSFDLNLWVGGVLLIGITEEIVFRGYILQKFKELMKFKFANLFTSLLFAFVHFPKWFIEGNLVFSAYFVKSFLFLIVFSYIQGVILKKAGSIWPCFFFHSANNFAMFALSA